MNLFSECIIQDVPVYQKPVTCLLSQQCLITSLSDSSVTLDSSLFYWVSYS